MAAEVPCATFHEHLGGERASLFGREPGALRLRPRRQPAPRRPVELRLGRREAGIEPRRRVLEAGVDSHHPQAPADFVGVCQINLVLAGLTH